MLERGVVIWGAGKIGRGLAGDIFSQAGYQLSFVDVNKELVTGLNNQGFYTVHNISADGEETRKVGSFKAYHTEDSELEKVLLQSSLLALAILPAAVENTIIILSRHLERRAKSNTSKDLDMLLCVNIPQSGAMFTKLFLDHLSEQGKEYFNEHVGIVETIIVRTAVAPTKEMLADDAFCVLTNGYNPLVINASTCKNPLLQIDSIRYTKNMHAEETRKLFTYNMVHAVYAYVGHIVGNTIIYESVTHPVVQHIAKEALEEISLALQKEFGFTKVQMDAWNTEVLKNMANPILKDTIERVGADPKRKVGREDRLIGPALLCRKHGSLPYYLYIAIACAYMFDNPKDESSREIIDYVTMYGIRDALMRFSKLDMEKDTIQMVSERYHEIKAHGIQDIVEKESLVQILKRAYRTGFENEYRYHGCGQCTIKTCMEMFGKPGKELFQATSGFSGGMGLVGDGVCGGYSGGILAMGSFAGRRLEYLEEGDKEAQYTSYRMAQKLHQKFMDTYKSVICLDIHEKIFGTSYCLLTKSVRNDFEAAGAHQDKCTTLIGVVSAWVTEILIEEGFVDPRSGKLIHEV